MYEELLTTFDVEMRPSMFVFQGRAVEPIVREVKLFPILNTKEFAAVFRGGDAVLMRGPAVVALTSGQSCLVKMGRSWVIKRVDAVVEAV